MYTMMVAFALLLPGGDPSRVVKASPAGCGCKVCDCGPGCDCGPARVFVSAGDPPPSLPDRVANLEAAVGNLQAEQSEQRAKMDRIGQGLDRIEKLLTEKPVTPPTTHTAKPADRTAELLSSIDAKLGQLVEQRAAATNTAPAAVRGSVVQAPFPAGDTTPGTPVPLVEQHSSFSPGQPGVGVTYTLAPGAGQYGATSGGCSSGGCANGQCGSSGRVGLFGRRR